jgi:hypothetical protein
VTSEPPPGSGHAGVRRTAALLDDATQRSRGTARERLVRLRDLAPTIAQTAFAAAGAWLVATELIGHTRPFFAPIAAIIVLGVTRGRHARRALDLQDNVPPEVIDALRDLAASVRALAPALDDPLRASRAREHAVRAAARATLSLQSTANLSTSAIVGQVRSTALDLLRGLGEDREPAAAAIRAAARDGADERAGPA